MDGGAHTIIVVISSTKTSNNYEIVCMYNAKSFIEKKNLKNNWCTRINDVFGLNKAYGDVLDEKYLLNSRNHM
jgi:hypothetical protein